MQKHVMCSKQPTGVSASEEGKLRGQTRAFTDIIVGRIVVQSEAHVAVAAVVMSVVHGCPRRAHACVDRRDAGGVLVFTTVYGSTEMSLDEESIYFYFFWICSMSAVLDDVLCMYIMCMLR